jgi:hypothetical protein
MNDDPIEQAVADTKGRRLAVGEVDGVLAYLRKEPDPDKPSDWLVIAQCDEWSGSRSVKLFTESGANRRFEELRDKHSLEEQ